jgi:hypothetical protein
MQDGIRCPKCNCGHSSVTKTIRHNYLSPLGPRTSVRRRRVCRHCQTAYYTTEQTEIAAAPPPTFPSPEDFANKNQPFDPSGLDVDQIPVDNPASSKLPWLQQPFPQPPARPPDA